MSQFFIAPSASVPPPGSVTNVRGDDAVTVSPNGSGIIFTLADPLAPGIVTRGVAGTNTEYFGLLQPTTCGSGTTTDVGTADLVTLALGGTAATYTLSANIAGKAATQSGIGGTLFGVVRTDGATATIINTIDNFINGDLVLIGASFTFVASGGNIILRTTGSLGTVINWKGCVTYVSVRGGV